MIASARRSGSSNATGAPPPRVMSYRIRFITVVPAHSASKTRVNALTLGIHNHRLWNMGPRYGVPATLASRGAPRGDDGGRCDAEVSTCLVSCQAIPPRIGPEALAVALREAFELGADVGDAARARVVHGPAAERRKPGGEDHGAVERILIRHHALAQTGDADVEHRENEAIRHLRRGLGHLALLHRLAAPPFVETPAALAAEVAHLDLVAQHPRHVGHRAVEARLEHLGDVQANVEADGVGKLDRPHGHAEGYGGGVDGLAILAGVWH